MTSQQVIALSEENILATYGRYPVAIEKGQGARLWDFDGKEYIDFTSGIGVNALGYGNEAWVQAVCDQAGKLAHISNLYYTLPAAQLAKTLCSRTGMAGAFFCNSGAESNEGAIKLARKYSFDRYGKGRSTILTLVQSFHGRTVTTLAATGQDVFHNYFFPFTEDFRYVPANDIEALRAAMTDDVCAVLVELVQGEGGVLPLTQEYVQQAHALCGEKDVLFMTDEVQTGVGRTGSLFCFQQYGILPDVCSFAKGIAGGLPMGGILTNEKCRGVLTAGTHATTFGGNLISAAAANAVVETMDEALLAQVREKGAYIRRKVEEMALPCVKSVRGMGLMIGIGVNANHKELVAKMAGEGLLALTAGSDTVRLLPPLTITYEEVDRGLAILEAVLRTA